MSEIKVYSMANCAWCDKAKALLDQIGWRYHEVKISSHEEWDTVLTMFPGVTTLPQIIINGIRIGGYDKLMMFVSASAGAATEEAS